MSLRGSKHNVPALASLPRIETPYLKVGVLILAALITVLLNGSLAELKYATEEKFGALGWTLFPDQQTEERVVVVAIDERSLTEIGPWPWPREVLAKLSDRLTEAGTAMQLYDIVLPEAKAGDDVLLSSLKNSNSVLAQIPILVGDSQAVKAGLLTHPLSGARCQPPLPSAPGYLASHANFASVPKGHITPVVDGDGLIRKQPPLICIDGNAYPSLSLQALLRGFSSGRQGKAPDVEVVPGEGFLSSDWYVQLKGYLGYRIPVDAEGNVRISYRQSPDVFQVVSAADVLSYEPSDPVLTELLNDAWVLVGATAFGLGDVVPTPHSGMAAGVELQARLLAEMLGGTVPFTPALAASLLVIECVVFAGLLLVLSSLGGRLCAVGLPSCGVLLPLFALLVHTQLLLSANIWLGWLIPAAFGFFAAVLMSVLEHMRVRLERQRVYKNLSSYLPLNAAREVAFNLPNGAIEASRHELVLMSADLRNFSTYEATHSPEEAAALLHCFFVKAAEVVEAHGGSIEEFVGDSVLASWAIEVEDGSALRALKAAHELQSVVSEFIPAPIALGVAIDKGPVLVGSIGPAHRRTHTLLGDTVTLTLRIQEMTEELAQPVLVGECAARTLRSEGLVSQGVFLMDGLKTPQTLYALGHEDQGELLPSDADEPLETAFSRRDTADGGLRVISGGKE